MRYFRKLLKLSIRHCHEVGVGNYFGYNVTLIGLRRVQFAIEQQDLVCLEIDINSLFLNLYVIIKYTQTKCVLLLYFPLEEEMCTMSILREIRLIE